MASQKRSIPVSFPDFAAVDVDQWRTELQGLKWFPLETEALFSDPNVALMSTEEWGAYSFLFLMSYRKDFAGYIDNDDTLLARWAKMSPAKWRRARAIVMRPFRVTNDGRFVFVPKVCEIIAVQKPKLLARSVASKTAIEARWNEFRAQVSETGPNVDTNRIPDACASNTSSIRNEYVGDTDLRSENREVRKEKEKRQKKPPASAGTPTQAEVGSLIDAYQLRWVERFKPSDGIKPLVEKADSGHAVLLIRRFGLEQALEYVWRYLDDADAFLLKQGHPLRLVGSRVNAYRANAAPSKTGWGRPSQFTDAEIGDQTAELFK